MLAIGERRRRGEVMAELELIKSSGWRFKELHAQPGKRRALLEGAVAALQALRQEAGRTPAWKRPRAEALLADARAALSQLDQEADRHVVSVREALAAAKKEPRSLSGDDLSRALLA